VTANSLRTVAQLADELPEVAADPGRLTVVIEHLVQNAQEATDAGGQVTIRARAEGGCGVVEVCDTGCGMDEGFVRDRLCKPFDTTKGNAGMGVGVYESREFVHSVGGRMEVSSEPGVGSRFVLWLPRDDVAGVADDLRGAWRILKNAGYIPEELELRKSIVRLEDLVEACVDPEQAAALRRSLNEKILRYRLLMERRQAASPRLSKRILRHLGG